MILRTVKLTFSFLGKPRASGDDPNQFDSARTQYK